MSPAQCSQDVSIAVNDLQDRSALVSEITDLAETDIAELDWYSDTLSLLRLSDKPGNPPTTVFDRAADLIAGAKQCWRDSVAYVSNEHMTDWDYTRIFAAYEQSSGRRSAARHIPTGPSYGPVVLLGCTQPGFTPMCRWSGIRACRRQSYTAPQQGSGQSAGKVRPWASARPSGMPSAVRLGIGALR